MPSGAREGGDVEAAVDEAVRSGGACGRLERGPGHPGGQAGPCCQPDLSCPQVHTRARLEWVALVADTRTCDFEAVCYTALLWLSVTDTAL